MIVRLPLARENDAVQRKSDPPNKEQRPLRALICDDHEATCKVIRRLLKDFDVTVVSSEAELYEHIDQAEVLLLDINLRGKHRGIEIMKSLRQDPKYKDLRIVAFTAHALPGQKESFLEDGFDDYMSKPFRRQDLIDKINPA
jgi:CheY-like chemotaxis protein